MSYIGPLTNTLIEKIIHELRKKKTKERVMENIIDPLLRDMAARYYPYFIMMIVILLIIIILLVSILIVNISQK